MVETQWGRENRIRTEESDVFDDTSPLSPLMQKCLAGEISLPDASLHLAKDMVVGMLERTGGNKNRAAALLNINRTTLVMILSRLKRLGLL
jgi:DNA-binding NtrC family response regulator